MPNPLELCPTPYAFVFPVVIKPLVEPACFTAKRIEEKKIINKISNQNQNQRKT